MSADVGSDFVNGSSYGDERRVALRPPTALLVGPIEAVWAGTAVPLPVAVVRWPWVLPWLPWIQPTRRPEHRRSHRASSAR